MKRDPSLVGRSSELHRLTGLLEESPRGLARLGLVLGEPGIGKTHLVNAFADVARAAGFDVLVAQAQPGTSTVTAGTLLPLLPSAPPAGDEAAVLWWARNTLAGRSPQLVVVIDDAHHADGATLAVCRSLADANGVPVVVAARSTEPWPNGLEALLSTTGLRPIRLQPLDRSHTAELVEHLVGRPTTPAAVSEVHRMTDGVPLAVRELTRASADAGVPLSDRAWRWDPVIASDPGLASLFEGRLRHLSESARQVLWLAVAADGSVPDGAAVGATSTSAVDEILDSGLLVRDGGWLHWSHALLGELAATALGPGTLAESRERLAIAVRQADLSDRDQLALAAVLDLTFDQPDHQLQLDAAHSAVERGRYSDGARHAEAAVRARPSSPDATLTAALAAIGAHDESKPAITRALHVAARDGSLVDATRSIALSLVTTTDLMSVDDVIDQSQSLTDDAHVRTRLHAVRILADNTSVPPEEQLARSRDFLSSDLVSPEDRIDVQGVLSIMVAVLGDIDEATELAAALRSRRVGDTLSWAQVAGFYGGALAALFSGDAMSASALVERGAALDPDPQITDSDIGQRTLRLTMGRARGHCRVGMPSFVPRADAAGSLRYGLLTRIYAVWELALRRDEHANALWDELQVAPAHLRAGPGFLEAFASVALLAANDRVDEAAESALRLADAVGPARSAAAWLLHDAARHGRASETVDRLDAIAASQPARYLPAMFADSARAMAQEDPEALVSSAAELRSGGFDLFAAELDTLASTRFGSSDPASRRAATRARVDLQRAGGPRTPIVEKLDRHPLTDRQREVCSLAAIGLTNREIAEELGIAKRTVENTLYRAYAELGVDRDGLATIEL